MTVLDRTFGIAARNFTAYPEMPDVHELVEYGVFQLKETAYNRRIVKVKGRKIPLWANPEWNTNMAIKQIKHRYKTPRRALAHSYAYGWY